MAVVTHIEDLRVLAKQRVPRMFYDYADSGSWTESTYRANEADFERILLRQRVAVLPISVPAGVPAACAAPARAQPASSAQALASQLPRLARYAACSCIVLVRPRLATLHAPTCN